MNYSLIHNMPTEDSVNNNVDENSNDHQYNQYVNYYQQFTNHGFHNSLSNHHGFHNSLSNRSPTESNNFPQNQQFYQRVPMQQLQARNNIDQVPIQQLQAINNLDQISMQRLQETNDNGQVQIQQLQATNDIGRVPMQQLEATNDIDQVPTQRLQVSNNSVQPSSEVHYSNSLVPHPRIHSEDQTYSNHLPPLPSRLSSDEFHQNPFQMPASQFLHLQELNSPLETDICDKGRHLLHTFAAAQFQGENLNPENYLPRPPPAPSRNKSWEAAGQSLRALADKFSQSQERRMVRYEAQQVNMNSLTLQNFFDLCQKLFDINEGGITSHRIIVLFTFISDVAIYQVKQQTEHLIWQLMEWSLRFLYERVCLWVHRAGGWEVVLCQGINLAYKISFCMFAAVSIVAMAVFIKQNWKNI